MAVLRFISDISHAPLPPLPVMEAGSVLLSQTSVVSQLLLARTVIVAVGMGALASTHTADVTNRTVHHIASCAASGRDTLCTLSHLLNHE